MPTIYTIGHSTRNLDEFLDLLKAENIQTLADVRTAAGSRKYPHFNKDNLANSLPKNDIHYIHLKKLGGWTVLHIMGKNNLKEHPYTSPAQIVDGKVTYS